MPRLRVLTGPSTCPDALEDISHLVNTSAPYRIQSDLFDGLVVVHILDFVGPFGPSSDSDTGAGAGGVGSGGRGRGGGDGRGGYFSSPERKGITWSIQVRGRFLRPVSADDVMFGNTFDRPLKLPWGSGAALKFMHFVDPTLEHALDSASPWALSPLICTMPYFAHHSKPNNPNDADSDDDWLVKPLQDDISSLQSSTIEIPEFKGPKQRRNFFSGADKRKAITFGPEDELTTDFCYGFLTFPKVTLTLPGGINFDLMKYWDGQPVRFVCCERSVDAGGKLDGPGRSFWCVVFEVVDDADGEPIGTRSTRGGYNTPRTSESEIDVD